MKIYFRCTAAFFLSVWIANFPAPLPAADTQTLPSFGNNISHIGDITSNALDELSGLAASRLRANLLWAINDGGDAALLYALATNGDQLGTVRIDKAANYDWEDMTSFVLAGTAYLLIADVGDNFSRREFYKIYVVKEPAVNRSKRDFSKTATIAWQVRFQYEDGPRDCEAVAVDTLNRRILLISKRNLPVVLYELPLKPGQTGADHVARRLTSIYNLTLPTGMDLSPNQSAAVILDYQRSYFFKRRNGEPWEQALIRAPQTIEFPSLKQQEAVCFSSDGKAIYITSEGIPAPLLRINLEKYYSDSK